MLKRKKPLAIILSLMLMSTQSFALDANNAQGNTPSPVTFPDSWDKVYTTKQLQAAKCSQENLQKMFTDAKTKWDSEKKQIRQNAVEKQVLATPKAATNKMLNCVDGALSAINSVANGVDSIIGILSGNIPWGQIGSSVMNQLTQLACNQLDGYLTGVVNDVSGEFMGAVNDVNNTVNGGVNLNTSLGNMNIAGNQILQQQKSTVASDAVKSLTK